MKGIFVQGVLHAFEKGGLLAAAYAGASASALPVLSAAAGLARFVHVRYWQRVQSLLEDPNLDLSEVMHRVTREWNAPDEPFRRVLFHQQRPRVIIPANFVCTASAAALTQSQKARRLGRQLLLDVRRKVRTWVDENLELHLFDTHSTVHQLTAHNMADVAYASTRMIHWKVPAWIEQQPYVDASYTCAFPVAEMVALGYSPIIAIATEPGDVYRDIFADSVIRDEIDGVPIHFVRPAFDLASIGVDYTACTAQGLLEAFAHGEAQGEAFLQTWN